MYLRRLDCVGILEPETSSERSMPYKAVRFLEQFLECGSELAEISDWKSEYANLGSARNTFIQAIHRAKLEEKVMCCSLKGVLYLIRL